ncbi:transcriptional regulator [Hasllibacter halocynthiae]|uniref:Transcriptional regulator n=1 Tax=Hasllibacter halocynthiae TaxID=595589 RepID=A0A2T0X1I7_9RHOB|nr:hypothetical protein [Hasllibacter halocynthiae]PRY92808.1 transcriptional regulator [Hasllibacter halocynthiae]
MPAPTTFAIEGPAPRHVIALGLGAVVLILALAGAFLLIALPDADAFDERVTRLFVENADLTSNTQIKLLEIIAQSGNAFADVLASYRVVIFVLLLATTGLLLAALGLLVALATQARRLDAIERAGIRVNSLALDRETRTVWINDLEFRLTEAAMETLSVLAEARLDGDVMTGATIEAMVTGKDASDCDEGAGVTRIKRLRDALGGQMVAALLIRTVAKKGYALSVDPGAIRIA